MATSRARRPPEDREHALRLRAQGCSVGDIAVRVGVARSTAWLWVRHLPRVPDGDPAAARARHARRMSEARWGAARTARDAARAAAGAAAASTVGDLSPRELALLGAAVYWCEGSKAKPWRPNDCRVVFINSDPVLLALFLAFLAAQGRPRSSLTYRLSIHETADIEAATRSWCEELDLPPDRFRRPTLKRHTPASTRHNTGDGYRGCLIVAVPGGRPLYWYIEGVVAALRTATARRGVP